MNPFQLTDCPATYCGLPPPESSRLGLRACGAVTRKALAPRGSRRDLSDGGVIMVQERVDHARRAGRIRARLVFTLIGAAALVVGAFLDWMASLPGYRLTMRSLVQNSFSTRSNMLHTVGAVSVLIAIVALLSLLDRTGWLTRLAGLAV